MPLIVKSLLTATYNCTTSFANIPGLVLTASKNGYYTVRSLITVISTDADSTGSETYPILAINGIGLHKTTVKVRHAEDSAGQALSVSYFCSTTVFLRKGDIVSTQAKHNAGDNGQVYYSATVEPAHGFIEIEKVNTSTIIKSLIRASYTIPDDATYHNVPSLVVTVPRDGYYNVRGFASIFVYDNNDTAASAYPRLAVNGNQVTGIAQWLLHSDETTAKIMLIPFFCETTLYLRRNDIISIQAKMAANDNCEVQYSATSEPTGGFLEIEKNKKMPLIIKALLKAAYTITSSFVNIPGLVVIAPKDGYYRIRGIINIQNYDASASDGESFPRFAKDGVYINGTVQRLRMTNDTTTAQIYSNYYCSTCVFLRKNEIISLQISMNAGDNCTVLFSSGTSEGFIEIERV